MAAPHSITCEVLDIVRFVEVRIDAVADSIEGFCDVVQLATNTCRELCLLHRRGICCVLYIGSHMLA